MAGRFEDDARREIEQQESFRRWMAERILAIHANVSAADVLSRHGIKLRYGGQRPEQLYCPFHGNTKSMAARFHPSDARRSDHIWCFVCAEQWDAITLTKKFEGYEGRFSGLLRIIERDYGLTTPEAPAVIPGDAQDDRGVLEVQELLDVCEKRLRLARRVFEMRGHLLLGSVLDRVTHGIQEGSVTTVSANDTLRRVLDKIGEKERACPDG